MRLICRQIVKAAGLTLAAFLFPLFCSANTIASYTVDNTQGALEATGGFTVIGTGLSGTPTYIQFEASSTAALTTFASGGIRACASASTGTANCYTYTTTNGVYSFSSKGIVTAFLNTATTSLNSSFYYFIDWGTVQNGTTFKRYGSVADPGAVSGRFCTNLSTATTCSSTNANIGGAWYYIGSSALIALQPQVYAVSTPTEYQVTSSSDVPIAFSYLNTTKYDTVGVRIIDQSNNHLTLITGTQSAQTNTTATYSSVVSLTGNHAYRVQGVLIDSTGVSANIYGAYTDFSTLNDQFFTSTSTLINIQSINDSNSATSTSGALSGFLNIPSYFANRVPFGYIYDIYNDWNHVSTSSSEFGALAIDFQSINVSTSTKLWLPNRIDFFSTTTVTHYIGGSILNSLNALASAVIAITWGMMVFRRAKNAIKPV